MSSAGIFSRIGQAVRQTPLRGRTVAVLCFLLLGIKQYVLYLTSHAILQEASWEATAGHYLGFLTSDFFVFFFVIFLILITNIVRKKIRKVIINILQIALLLLFVIDIVSLYVFQSRISILDLSSGIINPSVVMVSRQMLVGIIIIVLIGICVFLRVQSKRFSRYQTLFLAICSILFALVFLLASMFSRPSFSLPANILSSNYQTVKSRIQEKRSKRIGDASIYKSYFTDLPAANQQPNIIVVFAESFSASDSQRVGGTQNNLPYFDKIQEQGMTFTNFLSNGCTSDTAHVAVFQGVEPWKFAWQQENIYTGYRTYTESLPAFLNTAGYRTIFLSTASLSFLNQQKFLSELGFTAIVGDEAFQEGKKYVFNAAPDQELYARTLETIKQAKEPYAAFLQTISFHKPYNTPYGDTHEDALRYADKALYSFYQKLKNSGFFDNGLLIIVGDHRKMEPLSEEEKTALGPLRYAKPLLTVVGTGIVSGSINTNIIQHTDIFYAIKKLVGKGQVTVNTLFNDIFSPRKGRDRGIVFCRYFANRYGLLTTQTSGTTFDYVQDIQGVAPGIYKYMQAYTDYQQFATRDATGTTVTAALPKMIVIAHQGTPNEKPGNSLEGFLLAKKYGADGIEMDVSQTQDRQNIVVHGELLSETVCGNKTKVTTHTLEWIQKNCPLKNGEKIITLEEMLTQLSGMFDYYFIEIKSYIPKDIEQETLDAIATVKKLGMEDKVIFTSYDKTATYLLGSVRGIHAGRDTFNVTELDILPYFAHEYYLMPQDMITDTMAQEVADMGKKLVVYVVNTRDELEKLYYQGVQMIMTDEVIAMKEYADKLVLDE